ncbi:uncharacterized protein LOC141685184 [Apium graveolens]|uniref:uncharacterized protein LOC141685184 n=1 Tax=Apium graveolens TaxID=4045 RepID=UPI003D7B16B0
MAVIGGPIRQTISVHPPLLTSCGYVSQHQAKGWGAPGRILSLVQRQSSQENKERVPRAGIIHIILGGSHIDGDIRKVMDRYAREAKDKHLTNVNHLSQRPPELFEREADDIVFRENDAKWVHYPHMDALVIKMKIGKVNVHRAMVDTGSSADILTYDAYNKLGLLDRELTSTSGHLYGFTGNSIGVKGII